MHRVAILALSFALPLLLHAQDREWLRMWLEAQRSRPRTPASVARIAPAKERGTPLVIHGRIFRNDGATPAPGIMVFAYQTDAAGNYNARGAEGWRLKGWATTDRDGRFVFHTIRPGSYPGTRNPSHVHLTIEGPAVSRRWTEELRFLDDPFVPQSQKDQSRKAGTFGSIRPVTVHAGAQHVDFNIRITDDGKF